MSDTIRLTGITAEGFHGVLDFEKSQGQLFRVDAALSVDLQAAGRSDDLEDTVSYAGIAELIEDSVTGRPFELIEALAENIAQRVLLFDARIEGAEITVHKPQAPLEQSFADVSVTVERTRSAVRRTGGPAAGETAEYLDEFDVEVLKDLAENARRAEGEAAASGPEPDAGQVGPYRRVSLVDLATVYDEEGGGRAGHETVWVPADTQLELPEGTRDPELAADFPVRAVVALGSNLPDPELGTPAELLASAVRALNEADGVEVVNSSPVARTKPVGGPEGQPDYLNQVVELETTRSPHGLLDVLQQIEADHRRARGEGSGEQRWGPRTLDLDMITYAGAEVSSSRLTVPHPRAAERGFVLLPWSWMDPVALLQGTPVRELAARADDAEHVAQL